MAGFQLSTEVAGPRDHDGLDEVITMSEIRTSDTPLDRTAARVPDQVSKVAATEKPMNRLRVKRLVDRAVLPQAAHREDAGLDLFAAEDVDIAPGATALVKTGIAIELPPNTEGQVRPRSGLAVQHQVTVLNTPGTIDQSYRGEIGVILVNHGPEPFAVRAGMRIAQLVVAPVLVVDVEEVTDLAETDRGTRGFGSTGT